MSEYIVEKDEYKRIVDYYESDKIKYAINSMTDEIDKYFFDENNIVYSKIYNLK